MVDVGAFTPPPVYAEWYEGVESCLGVRGSYQSVEWRTASSIEVEGRKKFGVVEFPNRITMRSDFVGVGMAVRHEMAHHITKVGDGLHTPAGTVPCQ